jgi:hypothetical protein
MIGLMISIVLILLMVWLLMSSMGDGGGGLTSTPGGNALIRDAIESKE